MWDDLSARFRTRDLERLHRRLQRRASAEAAWAHVPTEAKIALGAFALLVVILWGLL